MSMSDYFYFRKPERKFNHFEKKKVYEDCTGKAYYWVYPYDGGKYMKCKYVKKYSPEEAAHMARVTGWRLVKIMNYMN